MYLSKHKSCVYYIYFELDGKRRKISTRARVKSDALKFLSTFREEMERRNQPKAIPRQADIALLSTAHDFQVGFTSIN